MKTLGVILVGLLFCGCSVPQQWSDDPAAMAALKAISEQSAEKVALSVAERFQVTDQASVQRLVDESKTAAVAAANAAVTRFEAQDRVSRQQWREQTMATISASLQGVGGALSVTANPILMGLGLLMGLGGILTSPKKKEGSPS